MLAFRSPIVAAKEVSQQRLTCTHAALNSSGLTISKED